MSEDTEITLVVTSKVKKFVKETYGLRTGADTIDALSTMVVVALAGAAKNALADNRKTIQARDLVSEDGPSEDLHSVVERVNAEADTEPPAPAEESEGDSDKLDLSSFGL